MDQARAFEVVSTQGWLREQPDEFRQRLLSRATVRNFEANSVVFEIGDSNSSVAGLADGIISLSLNASCRSAGVVQIAGPVIWLGETLLYGESMHVLSARTRTRSSLVMLSRLKAEELIAEDPRCLAYFARLTSLHLQTCLKSISQLLDRDPVKRVSARLVMMCDGIPVGRLSGKIELAITQDDLAQVSNLSRKTVNRVVGVLRQAGLIDPHYRSLTVVDIERLSDIAYTNEAFP